MIVLMHSVENAGVEADYSMGWTYYLEPVLQYSMLHLLLELASHCPLGQLGVALLQPCVLVNGDGT